LISKRNARAAQTGGLLKDSEMTKLQKRLAGRNAPGLPESCPARDRIARLAAHITAYAHVSPAFASAVATLLDLEALRHGR
jgi:hypothetical protein